MKELALPGVEHSLDGDTLTVSGSNITADNVAKIKGAIKALGFGIEEAA